MNSPDRIERLLDAQRIPTVTDLSLNSEPVLFVYQSTAVLALGSYIWNDPPSPLTPPRPLIDNAAYLIRSITLAADVSALDFETNITTTPQFFTFLTGDAKAVLFREPIQMPKYFDQLSYPKVWYRGRGDNVMLASFTGILMQGAGLIGKTSITLKAIVAAEEIVDEGYIDLLVHHQYPKVR
jgi:hypothetical protein